LDNNVVPSVESISNIRGHSALAKKASRKIGHIAFFRKTVPDFRGHNFITEKTVPENRGHSPLAKKPSPKRGHSLFRKTVLDFWGHGIVQN